MHYNQLPLWGAAGQGMGADRSQQGREIENKNKMVNFAPWNHGIPKAQLEMKEAVHIF